MEEVLLILMQTGLKEQGGFAYEGQGISIQLNPDEHVMLAQAKRRGSNKKFLG